MPASSPTGRRQWRIEVVAADRIGLLSRVAAAMNDLGFDIEEAVVCTWPDGAALTSFGVHRAEPPLASEVEERVRAALRGELLTDPVEDATVTFDDDASPWHTICQVKTTDRPGVARSGHRGVRRGRGQCALSARHHARRFGR